MNNPASGRRALEVDVTPATNGSLPSKKGKESASRSKPSLLSRIIGVIGEILITLGIIIALFIVWQLWWTTVIANCNQNSEISQIQSKWGNPNSQKVGKPRYDDPPAARHTKTVGDLEGIIYIPLFGNNWRYTIKYGVELEAVLDTGSFGHNNDTAFVGEIGNFAIAGHRLTYGNSMKDAPDIKDGDSIIIQTENAYYVYKQIKQEIVKPTEVRVISPNPFNPDYEPTERLLSITTCDPPLVSNNRLIVFAKYDHWVDPKDGVPAELAKK